MSSTNRSNARKNHVSDYYVTPMEDIELFLREFNKRVPLKWDRLKILDCCAGGNDEIRDDNGIREMYHPMSYPTAIKNVFGNCSISTYDIRENSLSDIKGNYLTMKLDNKPDMIITNPPFNIAPKIIEKAMVDVTERGYVIMLLRLNFFGSQERKEFFDKFMPEWCFVHRKRIGFVDKKDNDGYVLFDKNGSPKRGSTDSIEYMHAVFREGVKPEYTKLVII